MVFLTALYGLKDLGRVKRGERVLIHAAAGGVGLAALQVARQQGAEVYCTASPGKWWALRAQGVRSEQIASSRDLGFEEAFLKATAGEGVDVVLNSLSGPYVDASLRVLRSGGRFIEMGKTDIRDSAQVSGADGSVTYRAFDLMEVGLERIQQMLVEVSQGLSRGEFEPLSYSAYDMRQAPAAFRHMAQARHVGKVVLSAPRRLDPEGSVLVTGGTGELGQALSQHLVREHGVKHLVLTSRRGDSAPGAQELKGSLESLGAQSVRIEACDVSSRSELSAVLQSIDGAHPLTGVFHLSGVLDDGVLESQNAQRFERVFSPKVFGAVNLHELTKSMDLASFVLFSSASGVLGNPGQSNYAAANVFVDALAMHRRKQGLAALSLSWGLWEQAGVGMTSALGEAELQRMKRQGIGALSVEHGLALLDAALSRSEAHLVPMRLELPQLQRRGGQGHGRPGVLQR